MGLIHHFAFTVSDLEASAEFYGRYFGLREISRHDHEGPEISGALAVEGAELTTLMLSGDNCVLELTRYRRPGGRPYALCNCDVGAPHVCFEVEDAAATRARMEADGVDLTSPLREFGASSYFFARDPDGVTVEVVTLAPRSPRAPLTRR